MSTTKNNPAREACDLILSHQQASLCTRLHAESEEKGDGFPFGSLTPYDICTDGRLIICISTLSQHYRNIEQDPRGSLLIAEHRGHEDPQAFARATVLGEFSRVQDAEVEEVRESYFKRFPQSSARTLAHDFHFYQCLPKRIRWIGGFGSITWIPASDYSAQLFDQVSYTSRGIVEHMNLDHQDAMAELVQYYDGAEYPASACSLAKVNSEQLVINTVGENGSRDISIPFPESAGSSNNVREQLIAMLKIARTAKEAIS